MKIILTLLSAVLALQLFGQKGDDVFPPPAEPPVITASAAKNLIRIDGKLDELETVVSYSYDTEVQLLYDERNLYIGVFCRDSLGRKGVRVQDLRRDFFGIRACSSRHFISTIPLIIKGVGTFAAAGNTVRYRFCI